MKRIICVFAALAVVLSMTGCQNEETTSSGEKFTSNENVIVNGKHLSEYAVPVGEVSAGYDKHFENCKSKEFINLDWTNTPKLEFPELTECHNIEVTSYYTKPSNKEAIAKFENQCKHIFGEDYDSSKIYFSSSNSYPKIVESGHGMTYDAGARLSDFRAELENNDNIEIYDFAYVNFEKLQYLWGFPNSAPLWLCKGNAIELTGGKYRPPALLPYDLCGKYPTENFINDGTISDKTYKLIDGDYSIGEAISFFTNEYYRSQPYEIPENMSCKVDSVSAIEINGQYIYYLSVSQRWKNIPFDSIGEFSTSGSSSGNRFSYFSQSIITKKNDVDMAYQTYPPAVTEIGDFIDKIIPPDKAADIASENLTQSVKFEVKTAELIYSGTNNRESRISSLYPT